MQSLAVFLSLLTFRATSSLKSGGKFSHFWGIFFVVRWKIWTFEFSVPLPTTVVVTNSWSHSTRADSNERLAGTEIIYYMLPKPSTILDLFRAWKPPRYPLATKTQRKAKGRDFVSQELCLSGKENWRSNIFNTEERRTYRIYYFNKHNSN